MAPRFKPPRGTVTMRDVGEWAEDIEKTHSVYVTLHLTLLNHARGRVGWFIDATAHKGGPLVSGPDTARVQGIFPAYETGTLEGALLRLLLKLDAALGGPDVPF